MSKFVCGRVFLPFLALLWAAGAATGQSSGGGSDYRVGPRDEIEITVFELSELNLKQRVDETGTVTLPLVGDLEVNGRTTDEIRREVERIVEDRFINDANVSVRITDFRSRPITVIGAVKRPGALEFPGRWTLLEALSTAGGLAENHGKYVYVLRRATNGLTDQISIDLDDLFKRSEARANIPIFANDLINVSVASEVVVYCLGEFRSPGAQTFKSTERLTFLTALSKAGGLTERAITRKVVIKRQTRDGEEEIEINARKILAGEAPDVELEAGDVILVKESFF